MDGSGRAVLADFGMVSVGDITAGRMTTASNQIGTIAWAAPERLRDAARPTTAQDIYSLGCLCYSVRALPLPGLTH